MAKILITETVHEVGPSLLEKAGYDLVYADRNMDSAQKS